MNNKEVAQKVVDRILEIVNSGENLPWVKPWGREAGKITIVDGQKTVTMPSPAWNRKGECYKGSNAILLPRGEYITFNQAVAEGGKIRKGAKGWPVTYWKFVEKEITNDAGDPDTERYAFLKYYTVFNINDVEGLTRKHNPVDITYTVDITHTEINPGASTTCTAAEAVIADYLARNPELTFCRRAGSDRAYYSPSLDSVVVPAREQFQCMSEFYSTAFHELGHSTGHSSRCNRFTGKAACAAFGSETYSREELVAEMTAATLCNMTGLEEANTLRNSAAYIKSWSEHIKNDPLMFITACSRAGAAVDCILGAV